jgi:hypothetical protein
MEALKQDPKALAAKCGISDRGLELFEAGRQLIASCLNRPQANIAEAVNTVAAIPALSRSPSPCKGSGVSGGGTVPLVGIVGLASLTGMLSVAAVVAVVAINKSD